MWCVSIGLHRLLIYCVSCDLDLTAEIDQRGCSSELTLEMSKTAVDGSELTRSGVPEVSEDGEGLGGTRCCTARGRWWPWRASRVT
jgi:hypothetical protein